MNAIKGIEIHLISTETDLVCLDKSCLVIGHSITFCHAVMVLFVLEEKFAQAVCFLLVDLYLLTFQPEKALHLLAVLDKLSVQGSNKNGKAEVTHFVLLSN